MGQASPVIPGVTWEITRRCRDRKFLLRPDPELRSALLYCIAFCCDKWEMLLHALQMMTDHYHQDVTDPKGNRNDYAGELHALMAKCVKNFRGNKGKPMRGTVWEPSESYGRIHMESEEAFIESIAYLLANPVAAGLVERPSDWPGFASRAEDMLSNCAFTVRRPRCLGDNYPATATLRFCLPPAFEGRGHELVARINNRLAERVREIKKEMKERGQWFLGAEAALSVDPFDSPKTPPKTEKTKPKFRAVTRIAIARARKTLIAWRRAYRRAFEAFRSGNREIVWPVGTWWFARYAGVNVAPANEWLTFGTS